METILTKAKVAPANETNKQVESPSFGGRYSAEMERLFIESQSVFKLSAQQAERFARQAGADAGLVLNSTKATITVGKGNKDNKGTIKDASSAKNVTLTNALNLVHTLQWLGDAGKHGLSYGHTKWQLSDALQAYVDKLD